MAVMYTTDDRDALDLFGWDLYGGKPRLDYPKGVKAALGLWVFWYTSRRERDGLEPDPNAEKSVLALLTRTR